MASGAHERSTEALKNESITARNRGIQPVVPSRRSFCPLAWDNEVRLSERYGRQARGRFRSL